MNDIITFLIVLFLFSLMANFSIWFVKRTILLIKIFGLKKECGAKISLQVFPYRPMWIASKGADIRVEILNTVYLIRLYSGGGITKNVHFASENYSCLYTSVRVSGRTRRCAPAGRNTVATFSGVSIGSKVRIMPSFEIPEQDAASGKNVVRVLLLNPAPASLSFVAEEKNMIRIAFTGDDIYGMKVFTASTYVRYAGRVAREENRLAKGTDSSVAELGYFHQNV